MTVSAGTNTQPLEVAARGTGSLYFINEGTPYAGIQIIKLQGATTTGFVNLYYSNVSRSEFPGAGGDPGSPITASNYPYVWAGPDPAFSASLFTASAPASQMYPIGNLGARFLKLEIGSNTGGAFIVSMHRKT